MRYISNNVQNGWMLRRGLRGRWLTVYLHHYPAGCSEKTERMHNHPWKYSISLLLKGRMTEQIFSRTRRRLGPSLRFYTHDTHHRVVSGLGWSLFIGIARMQHRNPSFTCRVPEGYAHYTELTPEEVGYRFDVTSSIKRTGLR